MCTRTTGKVTHRCNDPPRAPLYTRCTWCGFTRHPSSGVAEQTSGTFAGLIEKIPYLQQLGITGS